MMSHYEREFSEYEEFAIKLRDELKNSVKMYEERCRNDFKKLVDERFLQDINKLKGEENTDKYMEEVLRLSSEYRKALSMW